MLGLAMLYIVGKLLAVPTVFWFLWWIGVTCKSINLLCKVYNWGK